MFLRLWMAIYFNNIPTLRITTVYFTVVWKQAERGSCLDSEHSLLTCYSQHQQETVTTPEFFLVVPSKDWRIQFKLFFTSSPVRVINIKITNLQINNVYVAKSNNYIKLEELMKKLKLELY